MSSKVHLGVAGAPEPGSDLPVAGIVLVHHGCVLLLRRAKGDESFPGFWDLPGGVIEPGESPLQGAQRELLEETGISTLPLTEVLRTYLPADPSHGSGLVDAASHVHKLGLTVFQSSPDEAPVVIVDPREHSEFSWMDAAAMKESAASITPGTLNILRSLGAL